MVDRPSNMLFIYLFTFESFIYLFERKNAHMHAQAEGGTEAGEVDSLLSCECVCVGGEGNWSQEPAILTKVKILKPKSGAWTEWAMQGSPNMPFKSVFWCFIYRFSFYIPKWVLLVYFCPLSYFDIWILQVSESELNSLFLCSKENDTETETACSLTIWNCP